MESQPLRLNAVRLRCSEFSQNISQHFTATCHYGRFTVICGRFRNHRAFFLPSEKLLQCSFWRSVDTRPIVLPRLRTHFADILMYTTTNDKRRSYLDTLISESMVSFADSPFKFRRPFYMTTSRRFKCVPQILGSLSIHIFTLLFLLITYS